MDDLSVGPSHALSLKNVFQCDFHLTEGKDNFLFLPHAGVDSVDLPRDPRESSGRGEGLDIVPRRMVSRRSGARGQCFPRGLSNKARNAYSSKFCAALVNVVGEILRSYASCSSRSLTFVVDGRWRIIVLNSDWISLGGQGRWRKINLNASKHILSCRNAECRALSVRISLILNDCL